MPPAWLCGQGGLQLGPVGVSFGSYNVSGGPSPMALARTGVPDVTPDSYRGPSSLSTPSLFTGTGYAGGDQVARWLIDHGVDAWLQQNGDASISVSLGVPYAALTVATFGAAAEAGVFVGAGARVASFGTRSWRAISGVAGVVAVGTALRPVEIGPPPARIPASRTTHVTPSTPGAALFFSER